MLPIAEDTFFNVKPRRVVHKLACNGCTSLYNGHIVRHFTTETQKHEKLDSLVDLDLQQREKQC